MAGARAVRGWSFVAAAVLSLSGCATTDAGDDVGATYGPGGSGSLVVTNASSKAIFRVRFSRTDDAAWGEDRLGPLETISVGESRAWTVPAGDYHVKLELDGGQKLETLEVYTVTDGGTVACRVDEAEGAAATGTLTVANETPSTIYRVRFSLAADARWGDDRLGLETIRPGQRKSWSVPPGTYHVKVELEGGESLDSLEPYEVRAGGEAVCEVFAR